MMEPQELQTRLKGVMPFVPTPFRERDQEVDLDGLRSKGLTMTTGAVGTNAGTIYAHGALLVPDGAVVGDEVRLVGGQA